MTLPASDLVATRTTSSKMRRMNGRTLVACSSLAFGLAACNRPVPENHVDAGDPRPTSTTPTPAFSTSRDQGPATPQIERAPGMRAQPAPPNVAFAPIESKKYPSGLATKVLAPGRGSVHPSPNDTVRINYTGWTADGRTFDASVGATPAFLRLADLVKGFAEGISLMVEGEQRRLWVPAALAYGKAPKNGAPPGDLVYDVELVELVAGAKAPEAPPDVKQPPPEAMRTPSGLAYVVLSPGSSEPAPTMSDYVALNYTGWKPDRTLVDSSVPSGGPATFRMTDVMPGWAEGLQLMHRGEQARFWIPAKLAYGSEPRPGQPTGPLVFDLELVATRSMSRKALGPR